MFRHTEWAKGNRGRVILILALAITAFSRGTLEAQSTTVAGVIQNASGQPVAGALVKVKSADSRLTFLVVSQAQGRYSTPDLVPGKYTVQGFGGGYQTDAAGPVEVASGQQGKMDLVLSTPRKVYPPPKTFTDAEYEAMMPEGEGKKLLLTRCVICHSPGNFVSRRKNRADWKYSVDRMRFYLEQNPELQKEFNARAGIQAGPVSDPEGEVILDYLAKNFGLDNPPLFGPPISDPNRHLPRKFLKGAEANYIALELDLGSASPVGAYAVDSQGTVWVSERTSGILGRLDPKSLTYSRMATPPSQSSRVLFGTVAVDPGGYVWFTSNVIPNAQWFQYDPKSQQIVNTYDVPVPTTPGGDIFFNTLCFHPDGSIWATGTAYHRIVKLDPRARKVTEYPVRYGQHPFGIAIGGDQKIWYAGDNDNIIVRVDPGAGKMTPYTMPTPDSRPRRMTADAEGNLWVNTLAEGKLVKVDYRTGKMTEYSPPTAGPGQGIDVDRKRNLIWFSEYDAVKIGRLDPRANTFAEFPLPSAEAQPWIVQVDPTNSNRVWWNSRIGRFGYLEVLP